MVMRLTEAQLRKYIDYIRREVRSVEVVAEQVEKDERKGIPAGNISAMLKNRIAQIYLQISRLEKAI